MSQEELLKIIVEEPGILQKYCCLPLGVQHNKIVMALLRKGCIYRKVHGHTFELYATGITLS